jgi:GSCFA family
MAISFRTELTVAPMPQPLQLQSRVLTMGSCFAEVIGQKMLLYKVATLVNPFGTIYNPLSLFKLLGAALAPNQEFDGELVERDGLWYAYDLHSSFAAPSRPALLARIRQGLQQTHDFLRQADLLVLTFGTAVGYIHRESGQLVANCHKIPQRAFDKTLLPLADMEGAFAGLQARLQALNPALRILFTLSPVRHLKETLEGNSVSKALLRVLCHQLRQQYPALEYFPAYELLLDDLRDYRFYKPDLIHPTEVAEDYIWEKFMGAYFDEAFRQFTGEWDKIRQALAHRPFQPASAAHQQFLQNTLAKLQQLHRQVDCSAEMAQVKNQLGASQARPIS